MEDSRMLCALPQTTVQYSVVGLALTRKGETRGLEVLAGGALNCMESSSHCIIVMI